MPSLLPARLRKFDLTAPDLCRCVYSGLAWRWLRNSLIGLSEGERKSYLLQDLRTALNATLRFCSVLLSEPERRLAAIVDFTFNLGAGKRQTSTLRRHVNQRDWPSSADDLRRWVFGGGKVLPGLVARRSVEAALLR